MLTRRGRLLLALGGGPYLAAWAFGAHVLYPLAIGLLLAVGAALSCTRLARPMRPHRRLDRDRPIEGDDVVVEVELEPDGGSCPRRCCCRAGRAARRGRSRASRGTDGSCAAVYRLSPVPRGRYRFADARASSRIRSGSSSGSSRSAEQRRAAGLSAARRARSVSSPSAAPARTAAGASCSAAPPASTCTACASTRGRVAPARALADDRPPRRADGQGARGRAARRGRVLLDAEPATARPAGRRASTPRCAPPARSVGARSARAPRASRGDNGRRRRRVSVRTTSGTGRGRSRSSPSPSPTAVARSRRSSPTGPGQPLTRETSQS